MFCACLGALAFGAVSPHSLQDGSSGGFLKPEQAAYDVLHYDLDLTVDPAERAIEGELVVRARVVSALDYLVLDLDDALSVRSVSEHAEGRAFEHRGGVLRIELGSRRKIGDVLEVAVHYGGHPRVAKNAPWDGGFSWRETPSGAPWIATSDQGEGADLWWPCKDHPSDEPESMDLLITVPAPLVCASNGVLVSTSERRSGWRTYHWSVRSPINNYGVALNIGPYELLEATYESVAGETVPVQFYVLPESVEKGRKFLPQILEHLHFFEEIFGPYPFRAEKYGVVQTPHLGMEHQTIIAYGNQFRPDRWGFDWLHHHELAHEWWGNLVTVPDWNDFWIHEGFATYAQSLYIEKLHGKESYLESTRHLATQLTNQKAVAPRGPRTTRQMYFKAGGGHDNDVYYKGACVLHTLRWLIGDAAFFQALRRMAYPTPELEAVTDGSQCRFATTDDFVSVCEAASGSELDWFFELYLRQPVLPRLLIERGNGELRLRWSLPAGLSDVTFPMPVPVRIGDELLRVEIPAAGAVLELEGREARVDPEGWVLRRGK